MMSQSKPTNPDDFQDPLEDYDPKAFRDPLEEALATAKVSAMQAFPYASISPEASIQQAVTQLARMQVACLLVEEDQKLLGVFSDRDVLDKVALEFDQVAKDPVRTVMTTNPIYVYDTDSSAAVLTVMAVHGFRHVPVLDVDDKIVGLTSPSRTTSFLQEQLSGTGC